MSSYLGLVHRRFVVLDNYFAKLKRPSDVGSSRIEWRESFPCSIGGCRLPFLGVLLTLNFQLSWPDSLSFLECGLVALLEPTFLGWSFCLICCVALTFLGHLTSETTWCSLQQFSYCEVWARHWDISSACRRRQRSHNFSESSKHTFILCLIW